MVEAATHAFRTPNIGRKLYGLARSAGFADVQVQILAVPDIKGRMLNFAQNIAGYAREAGTLDEAAIRRVLDIATAALEDETYFAVNPQLIVTATA